jgi:hypothetical protein
LLPLVAAAAERPTISMALAAVVLVGMCSAIR